MTRTMIIAAHPDDAELAMGGTIVKMIESGWDVVVVDLTDGEPTPSGSRQLRQKETEEASNILGVKKRCAWRYQTDICRQILKTEENWQRLSG